MDSPDLLPEPDLEYRLAHRLLGKANDIDRKVVTALVGRPRRFSELEPIIGGRAKNNLTTALARLRRDGLIDQRVDARDAPPTSRYELTELGILVVFRMNQMVPAYESAEALRRGVAGATG